MAIRHAHKTSPNCKCNIPKIWPIFDLQFSPSASASATASASEKKNTFSFFSAFN